MNIKADKRFQADISEIENVYRFISRILSGNGVEPALETLFKLAADEIFSNIAKYGFGSGSETPRAEGAIHVAIHVEDDAVSMTFRDRGKPFDPLQARPPNLSLDLGQWPVGGLGIYIVKNSFDDVYYSFEEGFNIFTLKKFRRRGPG